MATAMQTVSRAYDVVLTTNSGYPLDQNLYQSVKGMAAAARALRQGGAIVLAAECADGLPAHGTYATLLRDATAPEALLARGHEVLCVAGTHGKTTTTSMLAWILEVAGKSPSFLIGGIAENFGSSFAVHDQSRHFRLRLVALPFRSSSRRDMVEHRARITGRRIDYSRPVGGVSR